MNNFLWWWTIFQNFVAPPPLPPEFVSYLRAGGKRVLMPLGLTVAKSATDGGINQVILRSGITTVKISNEGMQDITKIVKSFQHSDLLIKGVSEKNSK